MAVVCLAPLGTIASDTAAVPVFKIYNILSKLATTEATVAVVVTVFNIDAIVSRT